MTQRWRGDEMMKVEMGWKMEDGRWEEWRMGREMSEENGEGWTRRRGRRFGQLRNGGSAGGVQIRTGPPFGLPLTTAIFTLSAFSLAFSQGSAIQTDSRNLSLRFAGH